MNQIIIIGNLGRDPEMRYTPTGQAVTSFSVASNRNYTTASGERRSETEWFNVNAWGGLAEICNQYLRKGKQVFIMGRLKTREYESRDGQKRFSLDVIASQVQFLGAREDVNDGYEEPGYIGSPPPAPTGAGGYDDVDDLPF